MFLSSRKVAMCLRVKIHVSDKFHSDMSHNAVGCKLNVSESTVYIKEPVFKQILINKVIY